MALVRCPNCLQSYGEIQDSCPTCGADHDGEGAEVEFDGTTRAALAHLGGIYGAVLEGPGGRYVLWCEFGVCLYDREAGLMWRSAPMGRVDNVRVTPHAIEVSTRRGDTELSFEDGEPLDDSAGQESAQTR